ncbi:MAG: hypothetical protein ACTHM1_00930 [Solirubrobacteraceae bacterium]
MVRDMFKASRARLVVLAACACALLGALAAASSASAEGGTPRWAVTVVPTPTNLVPESPRTEVDRLAVNATGGTYRLDMTIFGRQFVTPSLPYDASAEEVQNAIDQVVESNPGGGTYVTVTEQVGSPGSHVYEVTWGGRAARVGLRTLEIEAIAVEHTKLTGEGVSASFTTVTKGVTEAQIVVTATNVGAASTNGPVTLSDVVPAGLTVTSVQGKYPYGSFFAFVACESSPVPSCKFEKSMLPGGALEMRISVEVSGGLPATLTDEASVSGGGAEPASGSALLPVSEEQAPFGVAKGSLVATLSDSQAGSHPNITTAFAFNTKETNTISAAPKDVRFDLPVGFVGNTVGVTRCSMHRVISQAVEPALKCPSDSIVGAAVFTIAFGSGQVFSIPTPIYNIAPAPGEPAAFGFDALVVPVRLDTTVLSNGNYGVRVTSPDLNEAEPLIATSITLWGVPAEHNGAGEAGFPIPNLFGGPGTGARVPLLTNPQQCTEGLSAAMKSDPWTEPGNFYSSETASLGTMTGCESLRFSSSFTMVPDTLEAGAPAGYRFDLHVPQNTAPDGVATPNVKNVKLTLPQGTVVNPAAAQGLKACSAAQFYGPHHPSQESAPFAECPREAQVGQVWIKTPALEEAMEGQVYLAKPECEPCSPEDAQDGKMVKLYVQAFSEGEGGIVIKLEGKGMIDQRTGQITTVFENTPQLPFDEFRLKLAGGPRAVLANPRSCGPVSSSLDLGSWDGELPDSMVSYGFEVNQDCFGPQFSPSFVAGSPNIQAGEYTPFTLAFGRSDQDQFLGSIDQSLPPGLLGNIASVPLCKEPQAAQGTCSEASLIGHIQALTGPGADPFLVTGGKVFLTEGYDGAPYGLSILVPAVAGPYTLSGTTGHGTVVVRAKVIVDPIDAHLRVISDRFPSMLDGIPLQLKAVNVTIDKPGFTFNPTDCSKMAVGATVASTEGLSANVSSRFQVTNCANLAFKPQIKASTNGKTSRAAGASLDVKLSYPKAAWGSQANIASVKVDLPKQLPSYLKTLQKACPGETFAQNPASCPSGSIVGSATATTPILPVALTGPAYFVSHGGEKWPELVIVLSGYGVTVQLHGETFISKGVTSSTFRTIPDVPIGSFELKLPQGSSHALAANGNLCTAKLRMPTAFTAQNGMSIRRSTPIAATGCTKKHKKTKRRKK